jgi:hypothetical protein
LAAYQTAIQQVALWGPTNFAPIITRVAGYAADADRDLASNPRGKQVYHVLLIITDGEITDMASTTHAIVEAAALPLSIIIVGVGAANFDLMKQLDGDDVRAMCTCL